MIDTFVLEGNWTVFLAAVLFAAGTKAGARNAAHPLIALVATRAAVAAVSLRVDALTTAKGRIRCGVPWGGHTPHVPWMQAGVDAPQTFPQAPQFCELLFVLTQTPPQDVRPAAHAVQTP